MREKLVEMRKESQVLNMEIRSLHSKNEEMKHSFAVLLDKF